MRPDLRGVDQPAARLWVIGELHPQTAERLALPGGVPPSRLHVTLAFLGRPPIGEADRLAAALRRRVATLAPPRLRIGSWVVVGEPGREVLAREVTSPESSSLGAWVSFEWAVARESAQRLHLALRRLGAHAPPESLMPVVECELAGLSVVQDRVRHRIRFGQAPGGEGPGPARPGGAGGSAGRSRGR